MRTNWMARRVLILVSFLAPLFRHAGRGVVAVVRCSWLLVRLLPRPVLLAPCLSCGRPRSSVVSACYPFRPIVVSFGSPLVRQVERGECGLRLGLGSLRLLLSVACRGRAVDVAGAVFLSWVLFVAAVSMASAGGVMFVVSVACRGPFYRAGVSRSFLLLASLSLSLWVVMG